MTFSQSKQQTIRARIIDFVVLGCTFYASCLLLSVPYNGSILLHTILYASVILVSVRIGKHCLSSSFSSINRVIKLMLCNATGLLIGVCVMLVLASVIPGLGEDTIAIIFATVMAFFVLGTLSPILKQSSHNQENHRITS
jgi:hypothetical protein